VSANVFERVLVGVDGSDASFEACRQAALLAEPNATVAAVAVVHLAEASKVGFTAPGATDELAREAEAAIARARTILPPGATTKFVNGIAAPTLLHEAETTGATVIVLGSHGHRRMTEILIGGVAGEVLHSANQSVLITRPGGDAFPTEVVVGDDGTPGSAPAREAASALAARLGLRLLPVTAGEHEDAVEVLRDAVGRESLLVVGSRALKGLRALASVSERIAHEAPCSVLVVRS
jgi:nucleotide-binding universal stress UspA family protein